MDICAGTPHTRPGRIKVHIFCGARLLQSKRMESDAKMLPPLCAHLHGTFITGFVLVFAKYASKRPIQCTHAHTIVAQ